MAVFIEDHVFKTSTGLWLTAKKYTSSNDPNREGLTLLFTHCVGSHKEQWEPVIEQLYLLQQSKYHVHHRIREAWSFDWQNHGDAAVLNREVLKSRSNGVSLQEWALSLTSFVTSEIMKGHRIVPIGHSAGTTAWVLTTKLFPFPIPEIPYISMILIESTIVLREVFNSEIDDRMSQMEFVVTATSTRRDSWSSRDAAFKYFQKRLPWNTWDPRVLKLLVDHGLIESEDGVTLKCEKRQEAISYPDTEPHFECALQLGKICSSIPIHLIWGTRNDIVPDFIQESLCDASEGRIVASVTKVEHAGHMVVQEQPNQVARAISDALDTIPSRQHIVPSKL